MYHKKSRILQTLIVGTVTFFCIYGLLQGRRSLPFLPIQQYRKPSDHGDYIHPRMFKDMPRLKDIHTGVMADN